MQISETVEQQLPYLRRYARAVTGVAMQGDLAVETMLEHLLSSLPETVTRVSLFQALEQTLSAPKAWSSASIPASPAGRRALLLTVMEGFNPADAARILGVTEPALADLIDASGNDLSTPHSASIFIIEDEPLIVASLSQIITSLGHTVAGIASTHRQAVEAILQAKPDLILADIQLSDGSQGTEAVAEVRQQINVPAIFITAFPERLLTGRDGEPTFLVPKPFRPSQVKTLISQALFIRSLKIS
ncbi:PhyR family response regulator anti-anti-sigma factor [Hyphomonas sp.]|uniref:PhyR family response regulator anti-anti-sigma factor n=1 Tax=Hyphomonas sp. TaxID=87 RepID=UPI00391CA276